MPLCFYFKGKNMNYRKSSKCKNQDCICWDCTNRRNTSLTKCPNGNCRYCESEYPNDTRKCENFNNRHSKG